MKYTAKQLRSIGNKALDVMLADKGGDEEMELIAEATVDGMRSVCEALGISLDTTVVNGKTCAMVCDLADPESAMCVWRLSDVKNA